MLWDAHAVILIRLNRAVFHLSVYISEHIIQIDIFLQCPDSICWVVLVQLWHFKVSGWIVLGKKITSQQCRSSPFHPSLPLQVQINSGILVSCGDNTLSTKSEFISLAFLSQYCTAPEATLKGTRWIVLTWKDMICKIAELLWGTWKLWYPTQSIYSRWKQCPSFTIFWWSWWWWQQNGWKPTIGQGILI